MIEFCQDFDEIVSNYRNNFNLKFESLLNKTDFLATNLQLNKKELHFIISCIDLTTLSGDDTREKVQKLVEIALHPLKTETKLTCAAVCVYPARIQDVKDSLNVFEKKINVASVAGGFPSGQYHLQSRLLEIKLALADGAHEIDVVIDRSLVLNENWKTLYTELKTMKEICGSVALLKVILSVGDLKCYKKIYLASWVAMLAGVDFLKTSTGKETVNATLEYSIVICLAISEYFVKKNRRVGFKAAGGIKTVLEALQYRCLVELILGIEWLKPSLFRIGASSLLNNVIQQLQKI